MTSTSTAGQRAGRAWLVLPLACACQFMVILDAAIVNVALPSISRDLAFTPTGLAWVVNGYLLTRRWTFRAPDSRRARGRYVLVQLAGVLTTSLFASLLATVGYLAAIPLVTAATFAANRRWTFSRSHQLPS